MLATQTSESGSDSKDVKQWIKEKIARTIKALQKRYVTSDAQVTSEDAEANLLCCALEAVFIHGIRPKHVRAEAGGRSGTIGRKGGALPQPDFWRLLKSVTHRDVILELEKLSFISTGVGRCRAWVRLALNDGLLECYLASLLREDSKLAGYYQQGALLLDPEEREVLLSLLQGLASLSFQLSYKSSVLNEWTITPLALAGLCPPPSADPAPAAPSTARHPPHHSNGNSNRRKESWETASQSSSSGGSDVAVCVTGGQGGVGGMADARGDMRASNLSLDTTGSSQLSSSLSSDSLLQGNDFRGPDRDSWDMGHTDGKKSYREESTTSSQDSMREESYASNLTGDHLSDGTAFSSLDDTHTSAVTDMHSSSIRTQPPSPPNSDTTGPNTLVTIPSASKLHGTTHTLIHSQTTPVTDSPREEATDTSQYHSEHSHQAPTSTEYTSLTSSADDTPLDQARDTKTLFGNTQSSNTQLQPEDHALTDMAVEVLRQSQRAKSPMKRDRSPEELNTARASPVAAPVTIATTPSAFPITSDPKRGTDAKPSQLSDASPIPAEPSAFPRRSASTMSRRRSTDSQNPTSWISEEDFHKPDVGMSDSLKESTLFGDTSNLPNGSLSPIAEPECSQTAPSVVHRRQIGLWNPFRGLLKLGTLERRGAVGMWWEQHCELSPFEFRLYDDAEDRASSDTCSLLRCEEARLRGDDGRFVLAFAGGKRLHLRAGSRGEAEDWLERIQEAVAKIRPGGLGMDKQVAGGTDEEWEVIHTSRCAEGETLAKTPTTPSPATPASATTSAPSSPDHCPETPPQPLQLDWTRPADSEPDAIKESVVYQLVPASSTSQHASLSPWPQLESPSPGWAPLLLSLSLEALRGFRWQPAAAATSADSDSSSTGAGHKVPLFCHLIQTVRDVVPDTARGGLEYFRLVMSGGATLTLRAESGDEARLWRELIRGVLDAYLDAEEEEVEETGSAALGDCGLPQGSVQRLVQYRLKGEAAALLPHLVVVPTQRGLDLQNFRCAGCRKQIGVSMGKARLCEFSGQHYCETCHRGDTIVIPSRMVHNWDLTPREVCRPVLKLLAQIEHEPLFNLELLNPDLCTHADIMTTVTTLRQKLRLLGDYVLLCRSGIKKKLLAKVDQRSYLLESDLHYSFMDLRQIVEEQFQSLLLSLVQMAAAHIHSCDLCTQRGFICQICNADDIIFPFQFETTERCKMCKSVFHSSCWALSPTCPRCVRLQKYLERDLQD